MRSFLRLALGAVLLVLGVTGPWQIPKGARAVTCDYYASPTGSSSNSGLSQAAPFRPQDFFALNGGGTALAGLTLCLMDGTYQGAAFMLSPGNQGQLQPQGSSGSPVTITALNDGAVLFDGQGVRLPVGFVGPAKWLVLEGFDAAESSVGVLQFGSTAAGGVSDSIIRRVVAWDAADCATCDFIVMNISSGSESVLLEDVAAFGIGRKMIQIQKSDFVTVRRAWGKHEGYAGEASKPRKVIQCSYEADNVLCENNIATWHDADGNDAFEAGHHHSMHQMDNPGIHQFFPQYTAPTPHRHLGHIAYIKCGANWSLGAGQLYRNNNNYAKNDTIQDIVAVIPENCSPALTTKGVRLTNDTAPVPPTTITRSSTWGPVADEIGSQWTQTAVDVASGAAPATGNYGSLSSPWNPSGTNARVCRRYEDGTQTTDPLWPWPMDARIKAALATAGRDALAGAAGSWYEANTVTSEIVSLLGEPGTECRTTAAGGPGATIPPVFSWPAIFDANKIPGFQGPAAPSRPAL